MLVVKKKKKKKEGKRGGFESDPTAMQIFRRSIANRGASVRNGRSLYQKWTCRFASPGHARKYDMRDLENGAFAKLIHEMVRIHKVFTTR